MGAFAVANKSGASIGRGFARGVARLPYAALLLSSTAVLANDYNFASGSSSAMPIVLNDDTSVLRILSGSATQTGVISELNGPRPLAKVGSGELILGAANTFTGLFSINGGTIGIGNSQALGLGSVAMATGTTLRAEGTGFTVANGIALNGPATVDTNGSTT